MAGDVTSVFVSSTDPAKIWVTLNTTNNQVLFSSNGGTNFTSISSGLPALNARTVVVDENDADGVYVGLNIGVYFRNNDEPSWISNGCNRIRKNKNASINSRATFWGWRTCVYARYEG